MGAVFPLHGMSYDAEREQMIIRRPWSDNSLPLGQWLQQPLVEVCLSTQKIRDVLSAVRNKRGAHVDLLWPQNIPWPVRDFYTVYASLFVVEVGFLLVRQAALVTENEAFRKAVFGENAKPELLIDNEFLCGNIFISIERSGPDLQFDDAQTLFHIPHQGPGTTSYSASLWFIRAAGNKTDIEMAGIAKLIQDSKDAFSRL